MVIRVEALTGCVGRYQNIIGLATSAITAAAVACFPLFDLPDQQEDNYKFIKVRSFFFSLQAANKYGVWFAGRIMCSWSRAWAMLKAMGQSPELSSSIPGRWALFT